MNGLYLSLAQRTYLDRDRAQAEREQRVYEQQATPAAAANMATYEALYGTSSSELGLSLVAEGIPATDPLVEQAVGIERNRRETLGPLETAGGGVWDGISRALDEFVYDPIKGAASWGMMGLMSVYELGPGGSVPRTIQQAAQNPEMGIGDAAYEQQPFLTEAFGDAFGGLNKTWDTIQSAWQESTTADAEQQAMLESGEMKFTSNTGGGWFVNSDVAPDVKEAVELATAELHRSLDGQNLTPNQRYRQELEAAPQIWRRAVAMSSSYQAGLGAPMTQQGYANREAVMFEVPNFTGHGTSYTPWSPGRIAAATVFEPGTQSFAISSGLGDITSQLLLDPMNKIGKMWSKSGKWGRTVFAGTEETAQNVNRAAEFGRGFQTTGRNMVESRLPLEDVRAGAANVEGHVGIPGMVFHGGRSEIAETGLREGGLSHGMGRSAGYAFKEGQDYFTKDPGQIHLFRTEDLPEKVRKLMFSDEGKRIRDLEQMRVITPIDKIDQHYFDRLHAKLGDLRSQIENNMDQMRKRSADRDALGPGASYEAQDRISEEIFDLGREQQKLKNTYTDAYYEEAAGWPDDIAMKYADRETLYNNPMRRPDAREQILEGENLKPFESMTIEEYEQLVELGYRSHVPDPTIDMMENLKLRTEGAVHDPDAWRTGQTPLGPFDPPEFYADAARTAAREAARPAEEGAKKVAKRKWRLFGKTEKQFLKDTEDFYLPEGTVDEMSTMSDQTNRLGQQSPMRVVTKSKKAGTNQKVRVYGSTLDLSGTSLPKRMPAKVKQVLQGTGLWDHKYGFRGSSSNTNWQHSLANAMREAGVGRVKLPDGQWMVLDDFIGGSKLDNMGSRVFYADGAKSIHPSALASGTDVTPNQINEIIDKVRAVAKHGINADGTIDGTKLTRESLEELKKTDPDFYKALDDAMASGDIPTQAVPGNRPTIDPTQGPMLRGAQADNLVDDVFEMSRGSGGSGNVDRFFRKLEKKGIPIPRAVREDVLNAETAEEIRRILAAWIAQGPGKVTLPGGTGYGRLRGMMGVIDSVTGQALAGRSMRGVGPVGRILEQSWAQRQMAMMLPAKGVNLVDDPVGAYTLLNDMLINYGIKRGGDEIEGVFRRLRNMDVGDRQEAYKIMRDYEAILFGHLAETTDVPEAYIKAVTQFIEENGTMHIYNAELMGMTSLGGATGDMARIQGASEHMPGMSLTSEMWNGAMHIPDPHMVKRVTAYQNKIGDIANFITSKRVKKNVDLKWEKVGRKEFRKQAADDARGLVRRQQKADADKPLQTLVDEMRSVTQRVEIQDRVGYYLARSAMNKIWKPLVLLRGAWTLRILMDDQMRIGAEGMSMFNHPLRAISYAMGQPKAFREAFRKGFVDINGTRVTLNNIDEVHYGFMYQKGMMAIPDGVVGRGAYGSRYANIIPRGQPMYEEGLTTRLSQFGADALGRRLALSKVDDAESGVKSSVKWLAGDYGDTKIMNKTGPQQLQEIIALKANDPDLVAKLEAAGAGGDRAALGLFVSQVDAELHHTAGGLVILDDGRGNYLMYDQSLRNITDDAMEKYNLPKPELREGDDILAHPLVLEKGDDDILEVLSSGAWRDPKAVDLPKGDNGKSFRLVARNNTLTDEGHKAFRRMVTDKVQESIDSPEPTRFLSQSYGPDVDKFGGEDEVKGAMNRAVGFFYEWAMTKPSDRLSRSPLFAARYWRSMGERMPFLDDATRKLVLTKADEAGHLSQVEAAFSETRKLLGNDLRLADNTLTGKTSEIFDVLDEHAKAAGLAEVESTLFNLTTKRNISDSLNLVFPFIEAWGEFATRWGRLMVYGDRNIKNANRLQQGVQGLRESNPFDPTGDQGFFHDNEFGQEVFSYPAIATKAQIGMWNMLAAVTPLTGISPEVADSIKSTGSVESLNFASGILPGFGPIFQLASQAALSEDPRWDGIKEIISPFGSGGGVVSQFAPGWIKRMVSAQGSNDPQLNALWMSTVQNVIRTKIDKGDFNGVQDKQQIQAMVAEAEDEARNLLMVRGANTFWAPASPNYTFVKEDVTGKVHTYSQLGEEYRRILYEEANGDETTAFGIFYDRYGSLPESFTASKTYTIKPGPVTTEGYKFQRENEAFFDAYPATAMFLMPDVDIETNEFNYGRYLERLRTSEAEQWTGEQLVSLRDDLLGGMEWDYAMRSIQYLKDAGDNETYNAEVARLRAEIQDRHPYFGQRAAPGQRVGVSNDEKRAEIDSWMLDPNLRGIPIVEAAREYIKERDDVLATLAADHGLKTIDGSFRKPGVQARTYLRGIADGLTARRPEFKYLFDRIYAREISTEHDGYSPENVDFYGEDFFEATLGISPDTLPQFTNQYLGAAT